MTIDEAVSFAYWDAKKKGRLEHEAIEAAVKVIEERSPTTPLPYVEALRIVDSVDPPPIEIVAHADKPVSKEILVEPAT